MRSLAIISFTIKRCFTPAPPVKKLPRKLVRVMMPRPPICIKDTNTTLPERVKVNSTSTVESPVTQMALVDVKSASTTLMPAWVILGINSSPVPIRIMAKKLSDTTSAGSSPTLLSATE